MKWLDEYPDLKPHVDAAASHTYLSQMKWAEFMEELRLELEKPRCDCPTEQEYFAAGFWNPIAQAYGFTIVKEEE